VIYLIFSIQLPFTTSGVNMVVPSAACKKEEQNAMIRFLRAEGE
jgi:hypothetical protein